MSHQTRHALWSRQMTSHNLADRMSPSWKRDMFLLNLQRGHEAAMVFAIAQEYGCSLDASMEKAMNIKSPGSQVQVMMWCFCCDFLLIWSSLEIVILYTGILRGVEQPSFIGLSPMMRVPFPNPKTRIWRGFSKEVVAFPHQSWMPLLSVAFQPGYLDLGTAVAVVTMLSSDYVSWWNGGGAITQHRCRGLLGIHHLATARMSIIKNWIAFIGFISIWMVCLTEFSASKKSSFWCLIMFVNCSRWGRIIRTWLLLAFVSAPRRWGQDVFGQPCCRMDPICWKYGEEAWRHRPKNW